MAIQYILSGGELELKLKTAAVNIATENEESNYQNKVTSTTADDNLRLHEKRTPVESSFNWEEETSVKTCDNEPHSKVCACGNDSVNSGDETSVTNFKADCDLGNCTDHQAGKLGGDIDHMHTVNGINHNEYRQADNPEIKSLENGIDRLTISQTNRHRSTQNSSKCLCNSSRDHGQSNAETSEGVDSQCSCQSPCRAETYNGDINDLDHPFSINIRGSVKHKDVHLKRKGYMENDLRQSFESVEDNSAQEM